MEIARVKRLSDTQAYPAVLLFRTHVISMNLMRIEADYGLLPQPVVLLKTMKNECCGFLYHDHDEMNLEPDAPSRLIRLSTLAQYNIFNIASERTVLLPEFSNLSSMYRPRTSEEILNVLLVKDTGEVTERIAIGHIARLAWDTFGPREENIRLA